MSIENRLTKTESRIKTLEDALVFLTALGDSHNDQLEAFLFSLEELKANQQNTDEKLNALIDAQIVTEDKMQELQAFQKKTEAGMQELREVHKKTEAGMSSLQSTMQDLAEYIKLAHQRIDKIEK